MLLLELLVLLLLVHAVLEQGGSTKTCSHGIVLCRLELLLQRLHLRIRALLGIERFFRQEPRLLHFNAVSRMRSARAGRMMTPSSSSSATSNTGACDAPGSLGVFMRDAIDLRAIAECNALARARVVVTVPVQFGPSGGEGWGPAFPFGGITRSPINLCYNEDLC